jgi:hypothetical protein
VDHRWAYVNGKRESSATGDQRDSLNSSAVMQVVAGRKMV